MQVLVQVPGTSTALTIVQMRTTLIFLAVGSSQTMAGGEWRDAFEAKWLR